MRGGRDNSCSPSLRIASKITDNGTFSIQSTWFSSLQSKLASYDMRLNLRLTDI